jgi:DNA polymerase/3'-5' exonuclease PolX
LGNLLKDKGDNFKANAFLKVANIISQHPTEITKSADLKGIKGVGKSSMAKIDEFVQSGTLSAIQELKNESSAQAPLIGKDAEQAFKFL